MAPPGFWGHESEKYSMQRPMESGNQATALTSWCPTSFLRVPEHPDPESFSQRSKMKTTAHNLLQQFQTAPHRHCHDDVISLRHDEVGEEETELTKRDGSPCPVRSHPFFEFCTQATARLIWTFTRFQKPQFIGRWQHAFFTSLTLIYRGLKLSPYL